MILIAASGLAREVMVAVRAAGGYDIIGLLDDDVARHGTAVGGAPVLGAIEVALDHPDASLVVCAGSGVGRERLVRRLADLGIEDERFSTVVHPSAVLHADCELGPGTVLLANVVLTADVRVGRHVVAMPLVVMTHDDVVDEFATLCAGAVLGGGVHVGPAAYLGMNCSVRQNLRVGRGAKLGMGSALLRDLPAGATWAGVPAGPLGVGSHQQMPVDEESG